MRTLQLFTAGLLLASAVFVATMLVAPPTSEASGTPDGLARASMPFELLGP